MTPRLVEVEEAGAPADGEPVHWRLLTTLPVADAAWGIVEDYRRRHAGGVRSHDGASRTTFAS